MATGRVGALLKELYHRLWEAFGPQGWWPGDTPFEVAVGAILTQNTNWGNVARVMHGAQSQDLLDPQALRRAAGERSWPGLSGRRVITMSRPGGSRNFLDFLANITRIPWRTWPHADLESLRPALLGVKGIGPETADSILFYALDKPTFVVDAYTFRILSRHGLIAEACSYEELRQLFMEHLPARGAVLPGISCLTGAPGQRFLPSPAPLRRLAWWTAGRRRKICRFFGTGVAIRNCKEENHGIYRQRGHMTPVWLPESLPEEILAESFIELLNTEADGDNATEPGEPNFGFIVRDWFGPYLLSPPSRFLRGPLLTRRVFKVNRPRGSRLRPQGWEPLSPTSFFAPLRTIFPLSGPMMVISMQAASPVLDIHIFEPFSGIRSEKWT